MREERHDTKAKKRGQRGNLPVVDHLERGHLCFTSSSTDEMAIKQAGRSVLTLQHVSHLSFFLKDATK